MANKNNKLHFHNKKRQSLLALMELWLYFTTTSTNVVFSLFVRLFRWRLPSVLLKVFSI